MKRRRFFAKSFTYKHKLFIYFFVLFLIFTFSIFSFQYKREKQFKTEQLETTLNCYTEIVSKYIKENNISINESINIDNIVKTIPSEVVRITIIDLKGEVLYDNSVSETEKMESHINRPEIRRALISDFGTSIRFSNTINKDFYYYAKFYDSYYVRTALPYDIKVITFLKTDNLFLYFLLFVFIIILFSLIYLSDRLGKSISTLKEFAIKAANDTFDINAPTSFPQNELGTIGRRIISIYSNMLKTKEQLSLEKEKLIMHLHNSDEGIAIFTPEKEKIYANTKFIQYINTILDEPTFNINKLFVSNEFKVINEFIKNKLDEEIIPSNLPVFKQKISKGGKFFVIKTIVFVDKSFEIIILDISGTEKNRILKQEMTSNIAHELKTPVSCVRGYLETIITNEDIEKDKRDFFIDRSYNQILRLSNLIRDISLITKIEEAGEFYEKETINIKGTVEDIKNDLSLILRENNISVKINIDKKVNVKGNNSLIESIFRNLFDNAINYAGRDIEINVENYMEDDDYYYFSFYDNGKGVPEEHLKRLFERFYRIGEGRTRKSGGSGLGLSIVKNAVLFHKGEITAKNRKDGGLEFLFTLSK